MYPFLTARLFGEPLLLLPQKADTLANVLSAWTEGNQHALADYTPSPHAALGTDIARTAPAGYQVTGDGIAIVPVLGTLVQRTGGMDAMSGLTSYQKLSRQLAAAEADPGVRGIVLDVDSPGGEVAGAFELADQIGASSKPVYAHANEMAASAAYLIGSAGAKLNVARTGLVGSIGVVMLHVDQSVKDAKQGIKYTPIYAGSRKVDGNPHEPLSSDARATAQQRVDELHTMFANVVAKNRGISAQAVKDTEAGIYGAGDAVQRKLADGTGTLGDTVRQLTTDLASGRARRGSAPPSQAKGASAMPTTYTPHAAAPSYSAHTDHGYTDAEIRKRVERIFASSYSRGAEKLALQLVTTASLSIDEAMTLLTVAKTGKAPVTARHLSVGEIFAKRDADVRRARGEDMTEYEPTGNLTADIYARRAAQTKRYRTGP